MGYYPIFESEFVTENYSVLLFHEADAFALLTEHNGDILNACSHW